MTNEQSHRVHLSSEDQERLRELRAQKPARNAPKLTLTSGAMLADRVAEIVGLGASSSSKASYLPFGSF